LITAAGTRRQPGVDIDAPEAGEDVAVVVDGGEGAADLEGVGAVAHQRRQVVSAARLVRGGRVAVAQHGRGQAEHGEVLAQICVSVTVLDEGVVVIRGAPVQVLIEAGDADAAVRTAPGSPGLCAEFEVTDEP
jgi:hypothetical protein